MIYFTTCKSRCSLRPLQWGWHGNQMLASDTGYYHYYVHESDSNYVMWSAVCIRVNASSLDWALTWWCYVRDPHRLMFFWPFAELCFTLEELAYMLANTFVLLHCCTIITIIMPVQTLASWCMGMSTASSNCRDPHYWIHKAAFIAFIVVLRVGLYNFLFPSRSTSVFISVYVIKCLYPSFLLFYRLHWGDEEAGKHLKTRNPRVR